MQQFNLVDSVLELTENNNDLDSIWKRDWF